MALGGLRPVVALYSTFLNRAWDQVVYDVALHRLPVLFCLDRAGITGDDGPSHHGIYDMALLAKVPGMRVLAPSSAQDLRQMLTDAIGMLDAGPVVIRYPKGTARNVHDADVGSGVKARKLVSPSNAKACILAVGKMVAASLDAARTLESRGIPTAVWDVRSCAPLDQDMIDDAAKHGVVVTIEDGIRDGGIGMTMADAVHHAAGGEHASVHVLGIPTQFIPHSKPDAILARLGLDANGIAKVVADSCGGQT
jgi:1-deoxy-D-xylulose-5-phosphate synthase